VLAASMAYNVVRIVQHRHANKDVYVRIKTKFPAADLAFFVLSAAGPNALCSLLGLVMQTGLDYKDALRITTVIRDLKQRGFETRMTEDVPQFAIQVAGVAIQHIDGEEVAWFTFASIGTTLFMLFQKLVSSLVLKTLSVNASDVVVRVLAAKHGRRMQLALDGKETMTLAFNVVTFVLNIAFAFNLETIRQFISIGILVTSYATGLAASLVFMRINRDALWHCVVKSDNAALALTAGAVHPHLWTILSPSARVWCRRPASHAATTLRGVGMGAVAAWGIYKRRFEVPERFCICILIANAICVLLSFYDLADVNEDGEGHEALDTSGGVGCDELDAAEDRVQKGGSVIAEMKALGATAQSLLDEGFSVEQLQGTGYSNEEIKETHQGREWFEERERAEREAREAREAQERAAKEARERGAQEKAAREAQERAARERAAQEKAAREAQERAARERAAKEAQAAKGREAEIRRLKGDLLHGCKVGDWKKADDAQRRLIGIGAAAIPALEEVVRECPGKPMDGCRDRAREAIDAIRRRP